MPIRTNRGRTAVYRRIWGWPLRSGRHLLTAIVVLIVVVIAIAVLVSHLHKSANSANGNPAGASSSVIAPATSDLSGGPTTRLSSPPPPPSVPPSPQALTAIQKWGQAWVNHPAGMTNPQWLAQLQPYTTPEFLPQMSSIDLSNIAATQVTGAPSVVHSYAGSLEAILPTNGGNLDITVIQTPQGWQVNTYTEAS